MALELVVAGPVVVVPFDGCEPEVDDAIDVALLTDALTDVEPVV